MDDKITSKNLIKKILSGKIKNTSLKLINTLGIVALLLLIVLAYGFYQSEHDVSNSKKRMIEIEAIQGKFLLYDEILTMSARMAVLTSDSIWEKRYRDTENKLEEKIAYATGIFPDILTAYITKTHHSNQKLIKFENKAFELVRLGESERALKILSNDEYKRYKEQYTKDIASLHEILLKKNIADEGKLKSLEFYYLLAFLSILILFLLVWLALNATLRYERYRLNQNLEITGKTDSYLKGILENAVDGIISIDKKGTILSLNPATENIFGYSEVEMIGQNVKMLMPSPYHEEHDGYLSNYHETGKKKIIGIGREVVGRRKDSSTFPMELSVSEHKTGDSRNFTGIVRDVSERVNKQKEIEDQKFYYENLLENLNVPAFVIDTDHKVTLWNRAVEMLTGVKASEILGTSNHQKVIYNVERPVFADLVLENAFDNPETYPDELVYPVDVEESLMPGGKRAQNWVDFPRSGRPPVYLTFDAGPIYDKQGNVLAVAQVMQDITTMKDMENSIKVNNELLLHSNEELEQFAYVASHDLQEPLRMVASYTNLLAVRYKDKLDDDANDFINFAVDGAKRMQILINDLLSFSRLNKKGREFSIIDTDKLCQDVINDLSISIKEVNADVTKDVLPEIKGDELQIRQLFQNLISNAIKYSDPERKNKVHISSITEHDNCKFIISDSGIGIAPEYFEKIFIIFKRLHGRDAYSGTGIGLSICKKIVELHDGNIGLESELGHGSSFYFTLPGSF